MCVSGVAAICARGTSCRGIVRPHSLLPTNPTNSEHTRKQPADRAGRPAVIRLFTPRDARAQTPQQGDQIRFLYEVSEGFPF